MNKNIIVPLSIIIIAIIAGAVILFSGNDTHPNKQFANRSNNLRILELSVPGMVCAGCTASVEGYVSPMSGVKQVQVRLIPTKSATIVYDSTVISKEQIVNNPVFNIYGVSIISDNLFSDSALPTKSQKGMLSPQIYKGNYNK